MVPSTLWKQQVGNIYTAVDIVLKILICCKKMKMLMIIYCMHVTFTLIYARFSVIINIEKLLINIVKNEKKTKWFQWKPICFQFLARLPWVSQYSVYIMKCIYLILAHIIYIRNMYWLAGLFHATRHRVKWSQVSNRIPLYVVSPSHCLSESSLPPTDPFPHHRFRNLESNNRRVSG